MKLLLDECLPRKFKRPLPGHQCQHSFYGWDLTVKLRKHELDVILSGRQGGEGSRADWQECGVPSNKAAPILHTLCAEKLRDQNAGRPPNQIVIPNEVRNLYPR